MTTPINDGIIYDQPDYLPDFKNAIQNKTKIRLTFYSRQDNDNVTRLCASMDYGESRRAKDKTPRFHLWDYDSPEGRHTLSLLPNQVVRMEFTKESFNPGEFITWSTASSPWFVSRTTWGQFN